MDQEEGELREPEREPGPAPRGAPSPPPAQAAASNPAPSHDECGCLLHAQGWKSTEPGVRGPGPSSQLTAEPRATPSASLGPHFRRLYGTPTCVDSASFLESRPP